MASAAEQLAANINFSALGKAEELKKRIWFTLGALVGRQIGHLYPAAGHQPGGVRQGFRPAGTGIARSLPDVFRRRGRPPCDLSLNIMPYISASIIIQLMTTIIPSLEALKKEGEAGRRVMNQYTRYLTLILALFQSYGIAFGLQSSGVSDTGPFFLISSVITLTGGTLFLMWLGEQITSRGVGNGTSLIIFAGIVAELPSLIAGLLEQGRVDSSKALLVPLLLVGAVALVAFIVFMERAQRRILINYPKRQIGNRVTQAQSSFLPLKLNTAGVIPPIFASSLLLLPTTALGFASQGGGRTGCRASTSISAMADRCSCCSMLRSSSSSPSSIRQSCSIRRRRPII